MSEPLGPDPSASYPQAAPMPQQGYGVYPPPMPEGWVPGGAPGAPVRRRFPWTLVLVAGVVCCMLVAAVLLIVWNGKENRTPGTVTTDAAGIHYRNPELGIQLAGSAEWKNQPSPDALLLWQQGACVVSVVDNTVLYSPDSFQQGLRTGIQQNHPNAVFGPIAMWHGTGTPTGVTVDVAGDSPLHENWFSLSHGVHLTTLIEVQPAGEAGCPAAFADLERGLVLR